MISSVAMTLRGARTSMVGMFGSTLLKPPVRLMSQSSVIRTSALPFSINNENNIKSNEINLKRKPLLKGQKNEKVVLWKLYATFHRHNTLLSLVGVVEDLDFMEKNVHLTYNEKVLYYLQLPHHTKVHISAGQLGFRKAQRAEYEAGYQVSAKMFKTIEERNMIGPNDKVELILKDFGKGREAFLAALQGKEGSSIKSNIVRISDDTKLRFGGSRPKKLRRL